VATLRTRNRRRKGEGAVETLLTQNGPCESTRGHHRNHR